MLTWWHCPECGRLFREDAYGTPPMVCPTDFAQLEVMMNEHKSGYRRGATPRDERVNTNGQPNATKELDGFIA